MCVSVSSVQKSVRSVFEQGAEQDCPSTLLKKEKPSCNCLSIIMKSSAAVTKESMMKMHLFNDISLFLRKTDPSKYWITSALEPM